MELLMVRERNFNTPKFVNTPYPLHPSHWTPTRIIQVLDVYDSHRFSPDRWDFTRICVGKVDLSDNLGKPVNTNGYNIMFLLKLPFRGIDQLSKPSSKAWQLVFWRMSIANVSSKPCGGRKHMISVMIPETLISVLVQILLLDTFSRLILNPMCFSIDSLQS